MARRSSRILVVLIFVMVFAQGEEGRGVCNADGNVRVWPVSDSAGWNFGVEGWPNFKRR
jgi:hypothetical protein